MNLQRKQRMSHQTISIACVVPVFNEEAGIEKFLTALCNKLQQYTQDFEIIVVDDGSQDNTAPIVEKNINEQRIKLICFSRNFGKENALTAGLKYCTKDVTILIDSDFQHPLDLIDTFLEKWAEGYDMIYGVRADRHNETFLKRAMTQFFYRQMQWMTNTHIPPNAGDYRLLDKKVVTALNTIEERGRFMKGLYAWVGFHSLAVPFIAPDRASGKSSWRFGKLAELAITGLTAFSDIPLRVWSLIGFIISAIAFSYGTLIILDTLIYGVDVPGYATIVAAILFFGGIQLLSIGILGEYIGRIFQEVKRRPHYIIAKKVGFDET